MSEQDIRRCGQCSHPISEFADRRKLFCDAKCKRAFHNTSVCHGSEAMPYAEAWAKHRHAPKGSPEFELAKFARQQFFALLADYRDKDAKIGRAPDVVVASRMADNQLVFDRRQKVKRALPQPEWIASLKASA